VSLPPEVYVGLTSLRERGILLPPLEPPQCCSRCQRPFEPERQYRLCYDCRYNHGPQLGSVVAATYAAVGSAPWDLLRRAKFELVEGEALARVVRAVAAAIWEKIEETAPESFVGRHRVTVSIPSSRDLIHRCAAEARAAGWPSLTFDDRLVAEARPRQSELHGADERRIAAQAKYTFGGDLAGADVLLLDDVYTSGYTMHDAARAVSATGAQSVVGVVYARRVFPDALALYREIRDA
jgi:predicted amidophosphoribosyltransferase